MKIQNTWKVKGIKNKEGIFKKNLLAGELFQEQTQNKQPLYNTFQSLLIKKFYENSL